MRIFKNISIIDSIDSFCSTFGNELIYEKGDKTNLLLPCFNIGFYDNEINKNPITKCVDICYFLFEDIVNCEIELNIYEGNDTNKKGLINIDANRFKYRFNFDGNIKTSDFELEGVCLRYNSFSYGSYRIKANILKVIFLDETKFLEVYTSNETYKDDSFYQSFLLNQNKQLIDKTIKEV